MENNATEIWVTRLSAFQLQCGGVDRLQVWFQKPVWTENKFFEEIDMPFGDKEEVGCRIPARWGVYGGKIQTSLSFGALFGYKGEIVEIIWKKLHEHFGNSNFRDWESYESEHPDSCHISKFMVNLTLNYSIIKPES